MRNESMPGHFAIKAIAVDATTLYLETAPLDPKKVESVIVERMLPVSFAEKEGLFVDTTTMKPLIAIEKAVTIQRESVTFAPRSLWKVNLSELDRVRKEAIITLMDAIFTSEAYDLAGMVEEQEPPRQEKQEQKPRLELRLQLQLMHQLRLEQRPLLAHSLRPEVAVKVEGRLELHALLGLQQMILRMEPEELLGFAAKYFAEHGETKTKSVLIFVLAGRVKNAVPDITWKEARKLASKIASRPM